MAGLLYWTDQWTETELHPRRLHATVTHWLLLWYNVVLGDGTVSC